MIAEGANGPTTPAAEKVLIENKKLVIPVSFQYRNSENKSYKNKIRKSYVLGKGVTNTRE